jgi:hypothetical protein
MLTGFRPRTELVKGRLAMYDPTSILGYGAIGLGFLLAFFAYRLLGRPNIKERPIYVFEIFCLALVLIGAALQYASMNATANSSQNQALQAELSPPPGSFHRPSGAMNISNRPSVTMFSCWKCRLC